MNEPVQEVSRSTVDSLDILHRAIIEVLASRGEVRITEAREVPP